MSPRTLTIAGYVLIALVGIGVQVASYVPGSHVQPLAVALGRVLRTRAGRIGLVAAWAWMGLHYFAL